MNIHRHLLVSAVLLCALLSRAAAVAPRERSISPSRQFIIYGLDLPLRGAMGDLAERTKRNLLLILQRRDEWKTPIILNLQFAQANLPEIPASQLHVSQTGMGLKLQLDLTISANVDTAGIERDVLRAILIELVYRNHSDTPAGTVYAEAPPWLVEGVEGRNASQQMPMMDNLLTAAVAADKVVSLENFVRQKPEQLDAQGRLLYRGYAAAFLQFLLDQPAGPAHLSAFIESLSAASNDPLSDLRSQFPGLGSESAREALWKSAVAKFASTSRYEFLLSFSETQRRLEELLQTPIPNSPPRSKTVRLEQLGGSKPAPGQVPALRALSQNLLLLSTSAHPVLRPVVVEYMEIARELTARKTTRVSRRLAAVGEIRSRMTRRMTDIDDYLNWFEATQLPTKSGAFADYLKAAAQPGEPEKRRRDALSVYLDAVEAQFQY